VSKVAKKPLYVPAGVWVIVQGTEGKPVKWIIPVVVAQSGWFIEPIVGGD
jgi:hypothetical protein